MSAISIYYSYLRRNFPSFLNLIHLNISAVFRLILSISSPIRRSLDNSISTLNSQQITDLRHSPPIRYTITQPPSANYPASSNTIHEIIQHGNLLLRSTVHHRILPNRLSHRWSLPITTSSIHHYQSINQIQNIKRINNWWCTNIHSIQRFQSNSLARIHHRCIM